LAIEYDQLKDFKKPWLECDFHLFCQAFDSSYIITWTLGR